MPCAPFIHRLILRNYKSIGHCDLCLRPLMYLVGQNGAGKSNFMDALHFVRDALFNSLDSAMNERGGLNEVRRRSSDHPTHFGIRLEFNLLDGREGHYSFVIGSMRSGGYEVQKEECVVSGVDKKVFFLVERGNLRNKSESTFPAVISDRLALVAASGMTAFRPVFDALTAMGFYNLNPKLMRELQKPQDGRLLRPAGENIASVIGHLERMEPRRMQTIQEYLHSVAQMGPWGGAQSHRPDGDIGVPSGDGRCQTSVAVPGPEHVGWYAAGFGGLDGIVTGQHGSLSHPGRNRRAGDRAASGRQRRTPRGVGARL